MEIISEQSLERIVDSVIHAGIETANVLPFIFAAFLIIELIEHRSKNIKMEQNKANIKPINHFVGAIAGCVPQCGFAAAAAKLWVDKRISTGTLIAVFISTSDEALIFLLGSTGYFKEIAGILIIKLVVAIVIGHVIDNKINDKFLCMEKEQAKGRHLRSSTIKPPEYCCCVTITDILKTVVFHTGKLFIMIFVFSAAINMVVNTLGEETLSTVLMTDSVFQPLTAAAFGLIPGCLPSILTTQLYMDGLVSFPALMAALTSNAGIGLLIAPSARIAGILFIAAIISAIMCGIFLPLS